MFQLLATHPIHPTGMKLLQEEAVVHILSEKTPEKLREEAQEKDGVINRIGKITRELIEENPQFKFIGQLGVGIDSIDMQAATEQGIPVVYAPGTNAETVSEHIIALLLALAKDLKQADLNLRRDNWNYRDQVTSMDIKGKTLGIVGYGSIGKEVAKKADALGLKLIAYSRSQGDFGPCTPVDSLNDLFRQADFVSLSVPSNEETKDLVGIEQLKLLGEKGYIINCARGPVLNQDDLTLALKSKIIAGAAVDVYSTEPPHLGDELFQMENLIATPHMAALTNDCFQRMSVLLAQGILGVLRGDFPYNIANRDALMRNY
ncbi:MAG: hydroxyacid dehydrogenase [Firmicutes bacterium]|nr:hydroxyacid dehydrogenase [Bacillota bacterium]